MEKAKRTKSAQTARKTHRIGVVCPAADHICDWLLTQLNLGRVIDKEVIEQARAEHKKT